MMNYIEKGSSLESNASNRKQNSYIQIETTEDRGYQEKSTFFPLLISKTKDNWAVPISVHFRPECIGLNDCGLAGLIKIVN